MSNCWDDYEYDCEQEELDAEELDAMMREMHAEAANDPREIAARLELDRIDEQDQLAELKSVLDTRAGLLKDALGY